MKASWLLFILQEMLASIFEHARPPHPKLPSCIYWIGMAATNLGLGARFGSTVYALSRNISPFVLRAASLGVLVARANYPIKALRVN